MRLDYEQHLNKVKRVLVRGGYPVPLTQVEDNEDALGNEGHKISLLTDLKNMEKESSYEKNKRDAYKEFCRLRDEELSKGTEEYDDSIYDTGEFLSISEDNGSQSANLFDDDFISSFKSRFGND